MKNEVIRAYDNYRTRDVIHKEKRSKKENINAQLSNVQMNNSTIGKGSTVDSKVNRQIDTVDNRGESRVRARKDVELDQYLHLLVREGLIHGDFISWHAYCHINLGGDVYHGIVLDIRKAVEAGKMNGKPILAPAKLLSYKLKGRLELHFKQKLYAET